MTRFVSWWLLAGLAFVAGAILIPVIDGGELSEGWWSVMAGLFLAGVALLVTGVVKASSRSARRSTP